MAADGNLGMTALSRFTLASAGLSCIFVVCQTNNNNYKLVGDWISAPSPNVVDPQTMTHRL